MEKQIQDLINNAEVRFCSNYGDKDDNAIYYHEDDIKALLQALVSGRSELLLAFGQFIDADCDLLGSGYIEEMVKKFEASNSH